MTQYTYIVNQVDALDEIDMYYFVSEENAVNFILDQELNNPYVLELEDGKPINKYLGQDAISWAEDIFRTYEDEAEKNDEEWAAHEQSFRQQFSREVC